MKKIIAGSLIASILATTAVQAAALNNGRGGVGGFFVGCCLGLRTGAQWNEGKDLTGRELCRFIPVVSYFVGIWDGIDTAQGRTTVELQKLYPGNFY